MTSQARRERILQLLRRFEGPTPVQRLHSFFLLFGELLRNAPYRFVPTPSGPWSFCLETDLEKLHQAGRTHVGNEGIEASEEGESSGTPQWEYAADKALTRLEAISDKELLDRFHKGTTEHPSPTLFTIGYEGRPLEDFMNELLRNGMRSLCDVRKDPVSRKFGFSRKQLEHACTTLGMSYQHFPGLGIPKELRSGVQSEEARQELLDRYEWEMLPQAWESLRALEKELDEKGRIALICYEADPVQCHRSRIVNTLIQDQSIDQPVNL